MAFGFVNVPALLGHRPVQRDARTARVRRAVPDVGGDLPRHRDRQGHVGRRHPRRRACRAEARLVDQDSVRRDGGGAQPLGGRRAVRRTDPASRRTPSPATLRDGDVIPVGKVAGARPTSAACSTPPTRALQAIPQDNLRTVVDEADTAVGGLGPELSRIVDGSTSLAIEAGKTIDPITTADRPVPAGAEFSSADRGFDRDLGAPHGARSPASSKAQDAAFGDLLNQGGPALEEGRALFDRVAPALPVLLANMVSLGDIAVTYRADIEQLLVLFPQGTAVMSAIALPNADTKQDYKGIYLDFNLNLNLPPPCNTGFLPVQQQRSPSESGRSRAARGRAVLPGAAGLATSMSVACATFRARRCPASGRRRSRCARATSSTSRSTTATTGRATPTRRCPARACRSTRPGLIRGWPPPAGAAPPPAPAAAAAAGGVAVPYDPATGDYIGPDGKRYTQGDLAHPGNKTWQSMLVAA